MGTNDIYWTAAGGASVDFIMDNYDNTITVVCTMGADGYNNPVSDVHIYGFVEEEVAIPSYGFHEFAMEGVISHTISGRQVTFVLSAPSIAPSYTVRICAYSISAQGDNPGGNPINSGTIYRRYTNTLYHYASMMEIGSDILLGTTELYVYGESSFVINENNTINRIPNGLFWNGYCYTDDGISYTSEDEIGPFFDDMSIKLYYFNAYYAITCDLNGATWDENEENEDFECQDFYSVCEPVVFGKPTRKGYTFNGWTAKTEVIDIIMPLTTNNYYFKPVLRNIKPGTTYNISIDNATLTSGTATEFTMFICDFTDNVGLNRIDTAFGNNLSFSITCPEDANATHDIQLLIYSGVQGATAGNAVDYHNIQVEYDNCTGINEGINNNFSNVDELYAQLDARATGNLALTAQWRPNINIKAKVNGEWLTGNICWIKTDEGIWKQADSINEILKDSI